MGLRIAQKRSELLPVPTCTRQGSRLPSRQIAIQRDGVAAESADSLETRGMVDWWTTG